MSSGISIQVVPDDTVDKSWGKGVGDNFLLVYIVLDGREQNASQKLKVGKLLHLDNLKPWIYFEKCFYEDKNDQLSKIDDLMNRYERVENIKIKGITSLLMTSKCTGTWVLSHFENSEI